VQPGVEDNLPKAEVVPAPDPRWIQRYARAARRRRARGWRRLRDERPRRGPWGVQRKVLLMVCLLGVTAVVAALLAS
jgi:hypothetical protein